MGIGWHRELLLTICFFQTAFSQVTTAAVFVFNNIAIKVLFSNISFQNRSLISSSKSSMRRRESHHRQ